MNKTQTLSYGRENMRWPEQIKKNQDTPMTIKRKNPLHPNDNKGDNIGIIKAADQQNYSYKFSLDRNIKGLHLKSPKYERSEEGWRKLHMIKLIFSQPPTIKFHNGNFKRCTKENIAKDEHRKDAVCLTFTLHKYEFADYTPPRARLILNWFKRRVKITEVSETIKHMLSCNSFCKYRDLFHGTQQ